MKNILLISELYPLPSKENKSTSVCHYFTREWVKDGHRVVVFHFQPVHLLLWHLGVKFFGRWLENRLGGIYYSRRIRRVEHYEMEGVSVYRIPVFIPIPHGRFSRRSVEKFVDLARKALESESFVPDIITGHMLPLEIIPELNKHFGAKTCMVSHGVSLKEKTRYPDADALVASYDIWGFRARPIMEKFEELYGRPRKSFMCFSGIPESTLCKANVHSFEGKLHSFLYVGDLISRKYPEILLDAIPAVSNEYSIVYVGSGELYPVLVKKISELQIGDKVSFTGQIDRNAILSRYDEADCMIMVSENEAFGLVHLEAMARGCLAIASRGEGMDGIIVDGKNGFLCKAGDSEELAATIRRINALSPAERMSVSEDAVKTASAMTDRKMAEEYLNVLINL